MGVHEDFMMQSGYFSMEKYGAMQQPSPTPSTPSTGFMGPRSSPLFSNAVDQPEPPPPTGQDVDRPNSMSSGQDSDQAPPRHLANALDGLGRAVRHIADVRSGADLLLEALDAAAQVRSHGAGNKKPSDRIQKAADAMRIALDALRATGKELEAAGVLNGAQQRFEENGLWNSPVPFVAPDGWLVPYAWKRQIAGQAAATAYERARLALKAFTEQKRRFFPGLAATTTSVTGTKRPRSEGSETTDTAEPSLPDLLRRIQPETQGMVVTPYERLAWVKKSNLKAGMSTTFASRVLTSNSSLSVRHGNAGTPQQPPQAGVDNPTSSTRQAEKIAVLEASIPSVLVAVVSVIPAGSLYPDAVALFSPAEAGGHIQAWGVSQHKLYQRLSEHVTATLHQLLQQDRTSALELLLRWLLSYRTLFTQQCSVCKHVMAYDGPSDLIFPPLVRPTPRATVPLTTKNAKTEESNADNEALAYHLGCVPKGME
ncbi:mediator of RNA polymerase II transcription subunit 27 isoform X1 [Physcomitrium patens]|uniref:Mediator of RNA polymerase II transcription subunit 27 n=4 Tax=Physcomitrium patens TaxID=3218 RepID=A0A2K1JBY1_PHYPA|nr:mediator of RNA polymerase II transcription subunit 27-like isoform X1 [Physcomitrium patens]PNR39042.1 hypothetical protein PHYPA_019320 [Physcomitrium patens]|eukprot:XP_024396509.1 mediator of RNA polymerase II transcription subunit 27-like isoform X1 [Physcomitrella patens]